MNNKNKDSFGTYNGNMDNDLFSDTENILSGVESCESDDSFELPFYLLTPIAKKTKTKLPSSISPLNVLSTEILLDNSSDHENSIHQLLDIIKSDKGSVFSSDDSDSDENDIFLSPSKEIIDKEIQNMNCSSASTKFIHSLLDVIPDNLRDPEAMRFRVNYKYWHEKLARKIFNIYNEEVFKNRLPTDTKIYFNPRMLTTGGYCRYHFNYDQEDEEPKRYIQIDISGKICDNTQKLLEIMVHEMCHGVVFMFNKKREVHGSIWKTWCMESHLRFPLVPLSTRCHKYKAKRKYQYRCETCSTMIQRHSKSIDKSKMCCKKCKGKFVLYIDGGYGKHLLEDPNKPLSSFAEFVKENYKKIRTPTVKHKEVMGILSKEFQATQRRKAEELRDAIKKELNM